MTEPTTPPTPKPPLTPADLRHKFRRMRPDVVAAILDYHRTSAPALVPIIVKGILGHYLPGDIEAMFTTQNAGEGDAIPGSGQGPALDADSLTMLEIVLDLEEALGVEFDKQELASIRSPAEMYALLQRKIQGKSGAEGSPDERAG